MCVCVRTCVCVGACESAGEHLWVILRVPPFLPLFFKGSFVSVVPHLDNVGKRIAMRKPFVKQSRPMCSPKPADQQKSSWEHRRECFLLECIKTGK